MAAFDKARLKEIIVKELEVPEGRELKDEDRFIEDLGADALDVIGLLMKLENEAGITISEDDAAGLVTVGNTLDYLKTHWAA